MLVFKARPRRDPAQREDLTESQKRIMRLMSAAMKQVRDQIEENEGLLMDALQHSTADKVAALVTVEPWLEMQEALQDELQAELIAAGERVKLPRIEKALATFRFDAPNKDASNFAVQQGASLVTEVISDQRNTIKSLVSEAQLGRGLPPKAMARQLKNTVGLTTQQAGWVRNFEDRAVNQAMAAGKTFDQALEGSQKATQRYHDKIHRYRTETIARTETLKASNEGRNEAWKQGIDEGFVNPNSLKRWQAEGSACDICAPLDGTEVGVLLSFPEGDPPRHPNCRCNVQLVDEIPEDILGMTDAELDAEISSLIETVQVPGAGSKVTLSPSEFNEMSLFSGKGHIIGKTPEGAPIFTPQRQAIHNKILEETIGAATKSKDKTYNMLGGGPASGKTTALGDMAGYADDAVAKIDPDAIKGKLPEYQDMVEAGDDFAAAFVHEESSYLAKRIQQAALERRVDVLLDGTGNGSKAGLSKKIKAAQENGYKVKGYYATIPIKEAIKRSTSRAAKSGRKVPLKQIVDTHAKVSDVFMTAVKEMDEVVLFDTSSTPRLIARGVGGKLEVVDQAAFTAFKNKALETVDDYS